MTKKKESEEKKKKHVLTDFFCTIFLRSVNYGFCLAQTLSSFRTAFRYSLFVSFDVLFHIRIGFFWSPVAFIT